MDNNKIDLLEVLKSRKIWAGFVPGVKSPMITKTRDAKSNNESTWQNYESATKTFGNNVGIFADGSTLLIDFDHVTKNGTATDGIIDDPITSKFLEECDTYTEWSPSKTGAHAIFFVTEPLELETHTYQIDINIGRKYEYWGDDNRFFTITGNSINNLPIRTIDSHEAFKLLATLGYGKDKPLLKTFQPNNKSNGTAPWDWFNNNMTIEEMLEVFGWKKIHIDNTGKQSWQRPGKNGRGVSATFNYDGNQLFRVFSSSVPGFDNEKSYTKFGVYAVLNYDGDIKRAVRDICKKYPESNVLKNNIQTIAESISKITFLEDSRGPILNTENVKRLLASNMQIRFDNFKQRVEIFENNNWKVWTEGDDVKMQNKIACLHPSFTRVTKFMAQDAIMALARENAIDSAQEYFQDLIWDGVNRIDTWLSNTYGVEQNEVNKAIGANWLKGLANRVAVPGCRFDYVLVIEGRQGIRKSTSFSILGGDWHTETVGSPKDKDFFINMQGNLIVEFSEGETLSRGEMKELKAVITRTVDDIRLPYDKTTSHLPRRCVFAMTTNEDRYLKDTTGNRRWLPVKVPDDFIVNTEWLEQNCEQLLAEAYHRVVALKETYHEFPAEIAELQDERVIEDPMEELIMNAFDKYTWEQISNGELTTQTLYQMVYNPHNQQIALRPMTKADEMVFASILKRKLHMFKDRRQIDGVKKPRWCITDKTPKPSGYNAEFASIPYKTA